MSSFVNVSLFYLFLYLSSFFEIICQKFEEDYFSTPDVIKEAGYPQETHEVTTRTGYKIVIHRIPKPRYHDYDIITNVTDRPAILLYHGFAQASVHWLLTGSSSSLGFILADKGYDVWLTNLRGNIYSDQHINMTTKDKKYWNFSFHEMGAEDFPASIDYILEHTSQKQLYLLGYNLGNTIIFAGLAINQDYHRKVKMVISLAPLVFLKSAKSPWMTAAHNPAMAIFFEMLKSTFNVATYPLSEADLPIWQKFFKEYCENEWEKMTTICTNLHLIGVGTDFLHMASVINAFGVHDVSGKVIPASPSLTSFKTMIHLAQIASTHRFQLYDYRLKNAELYNMLRPPHYRIHNIYTPISIIGAPNDTLSCAEDIDYLITLLPNAYRNYSVPVTSFTHKDFLYSHSAAKLVYHPVVRLLNQCESAPKACVPREWL